MSKEDFQQTGLEKLSTAELELLDKWMLNFANSVADAVTKQKVNSKAVAGNAEAPKSKLPMAAAIESKIDGNFEGWSGETIFKLMNGQIWQQANYSYVYHYAFMPDVTIYSAASGWKMKVDGVDETIEVRRLR